MKTKGLIKYFEKKYGKKLIQFSWKECVNVSQSQDPYLTEEFIRKFKDKVNWNCISYYQKLSGEFIEEFKNRVDWYWISKCQDLSGEFIEEFEDEIKPKYLSKHNKINYLKYRLKSGKINNEEYLKELICTQKN